MQNEPSRAHQKSILIVDDDQVVCKAMSLLLTKNGYRVLTAECGADAISLLGRDKPDLVLLDLDFPPDPASALSDGFLTFEWARRFGIAFNVPFIILSSLDPAQYQKRAQAAGLSICFRKPVEERQLLAAIRTSLGEPPAS
jgi:CheY-like chemotaxis protein